MLATGSREDRNRGCGNPFPVSLNMLDHASNRTAAKMRIAFASNHDAVALKSVLVEHVRSGGHDVIDLGTHGTASVDYPDYGRALGGAIADGRADVAKLSMPSQF